MRQVAATLALTLLALLPPVASASEVTVTVAIVQTPIGAAGSVGVFCTSDVPLAGIRVPLILDDPDILIDSVSFANSIAGPQFVRNSQLSNSNRRGFTDILPDVNFLALIQPNDDELFRIHYRVRPDATPGFVPIDTFRTRHQLNELVWFDQLEASDDEGLMILPDFLWGGIHIADVPTDAADESVVLPGRFVLQQNHPNPFNPATTIPFSIPTPAALSLKVFDITGRVVWRGAAGNLSAGDHEIAFDGTSLPSGVYFYRLNTPFGSLTRKMTLVK